MKTLITLLFALALATAAHAAGSPAADDLAGRIPIAKTVTLTVTADGTQPFTYQWFRDGVAIPGATAADLVLPNFTAEQGGLYHATVSNEAGSTTSNKVQLTPVKAPSKSTITVNIAVGTVNP